jgi:hypothetical protein
VSDDFFSGFSSWWQESWQSGFNAPSVGPKVGRGLFSNWFLSERDRELADLEGLHARMLETFEASILSASDHRSEFRQDIIKTAYLESELPFNRGVFEALYDLVDQFLNEELYGFPEYDPGDIAALNLKTRVDLREYLMRKERFFISPEKRLDIIQVTLRELAYGILARIDDTGLGEENEGEGSLILDVSLTHLVRDAPAGLQEIIELICSESRMAFANEVLIPLRVQLMLNLTIASNIDPANPDVRKPFILPAKASGTPVELVERYFAYTPLEAFLEAPIPLTISSDVRSEHALIVGGSGHGKSQLLLKLIHDDLIRAEDTAPGVIVIDSQGDLIQTIARLHLFDPTTAKSLHDRLIIIDPADVEFPISLNLFAFNEERLEGYSRADRERVLNSIVDLFEYFFAALLGAELTQKQGVVFRYLARLMMVIPGANVQTLRALMEDGRPYRSYMEKLEGSARHFFKTEFFSRGFSATKQQILRRLWGVLANPVFERMFSQEDNRIDLFEAMNDGKIILINTAKDLLKAEGCSIFGRFFIAKIAQAALERATLSEGDRRMTHVYIDEAHDYFDETLDQLFNQARKYKVGLHIAAQHLEQMPARLRSTVMASTSLKFAGGVSSKDARVLADEMHSSPDFLRSMRKHRGRSEFAAFVKNRTQGALTISVELGFVNSQPTLDDDQFQALIDQNRAKFCKPIDEVEAFIASAHDDDAPIETDAPVQNAAETKPIQVPTPTENRAKADDTPIEPTNSEPAAEPATIDPQPAVDAQQPTATAPSKVEVDKYVAGIGGRQHTRLQQYVRSLGQDRNFIATIEKAVPDGKGSVDVALERDDLSIAVEISVSTHAAHEVKNIVKCIEAGFDEVFLVVPDNKRRIKFANDIPASLDNAQAKMLKIMAPEDLPKALNERAAKLAASEKFVRGYRVSSHYRPISEEDAKFKRQTVAKIIAEAAHSKKDSDDAV